MLYPSETYSSLAPLKICRPLGMRVQVPPSAPKSAWLNLNRRFPLCCAPDLG